MAEAVFLREIAVPLLLFRRFSYIMKKSAFFDFLKKFSKYVNLFPRFRICPV